MDELSGLRIYTACGYMQNSIGVVPVCLQWLEFESADKSLYKLWYKGSLLLMGAKELYTAVPVTLFIESNYTYF